jgi:hypothetical protein
MGSLYSSRHSSAKKSSLQGLWLVTVKAPQETIARQLLIAYHKSFAAVRTVVTCLISWPYLKICELRSISSLAKLQAVTDGTPEDSR